NEKERVVAESVRAAGFGGDAAAAGGFGPQADVAVGIGERRMTDVLRPAALVGNAGEFGDEFGVVSFVGGAFAAEASRVHAGRPPQGVDHQAAVFGEGPAA